MPSGKVHDGITVAAAVAAAPVWWYVTPPPFDPTVALTLAATTLFSGILLSPDLDLDSSVYRRWGPLRGIWWPYQKIVPHRSRLSHSFVLAPLLRVVYFAFVLWLLLRGATWVLAQFVAFDRGAVSRAAGDLLVALWHTHQHHAEAAAIGLVLGSALHVAADLAWTGIKRMT